MLEKVHKFILENETLKPGSKVILAFSYGVDSRVLLDILLKLKYEVILAHVNHKHRLESEHEEKMAYVLANKLNLKLYVFHLKENKKENFHDQAHKARYQFFKEVATKENTPFIVTAHHQDDNAETIILNLIKGSNLYGYSGINPILKKDNLILIRPLLCVSKAEIKEYQIIHNLEYFEDCSNNQDDFTRNRIRHHILPLMKAENPNLLTNLMNYSNILRNSFNHIRHSSIEFLTSWNNKIVLEAYKTFDIALRLDILSLYLENLDLNKNYNLITSLDNILLNNRPQADVRLNKNYIFKKRYDNAYIEPAQIREEISYQLTQNNVIYTKNMRFYFTKNLPSSNANYINLCYNDLVYPLQLRTRRNGDKILMPYGHKKIKDLLMDYHLPKEKRDEVLLLESGNEILWVVGYAKSAKLLAMKEKGDIFLVYEVYDEK